jgi:hypothetical protein
MTSGAQRLRELERTAKQEKKGIWTNYVPAPTNQVSGLLLPAAEQIASTVTDMSLACWRCH